MLSSFPLSKRGGKDKQNQKDGQKQGQQKPREQVYVPPKFHGRIETDHVLVGKDNTFGIPFGVPVEAIFEHIRTNQYTLIEPILKKGYNLNNKLFEGAYVAGPVAVYYGDTRAVKFVRDSIEGVFRIGGRVADADNIKKKSLLELSSICVKILDELIENKYGENFDDNHNDKSKALIEVILTNLNVFFSGVAIDILRPARAPRGGPAARAGPAARGDRGRGGPGRGGRGRPRRGGGEREIHELQFGGVGDGDEDEEEEEEEKEVKDKGKSKSIEDIQNLFKEVTAVKFFNVSEYQPDFLIKRKIEEERKAKVEAESESKRKAEDESESESKRKAEDESESESKRKAELEEEKKYLNPFMEIDKKWLKRETISEIYTELEKFPKLERNRQLEKKLCTTTIVNWLKSTNYVITDRAIRNILKIGVAQDDLIYCLKYLIAEDDVKISIDKNTNLLKPDEISVKKTELTKPPVPITGYSGFIEAQKKAESEAETEAEARGSSEVLSLIQKEKARLSDVTKQLKKEELEMKKKTEAESRQKPKAKTEAKAKADEEGIELTTFRQRGGRYTGPLHVASFPLGTPGLAEPAWYEIEPKSMNNLTPLQYAVGYGSVDCVRVLIRNGADFTVSTLAGISLRDLASARKENDFRTKDVKQILKFILDAYGAAYNDYNLRKMKDNYVDEANLRDDEKREKDLLNFVYTKTFKALKKGKSTSDVLGEVEEKAKKQGKQDSLDKKPEDENYTKEDKQPNKNLRDAYILGYKIGEAERAGTADGNSRVTSPRNTYYLDPNTPQEIKNAYLEAFQKIKGANIYSGFKDGVAGKERTPPGSGFLKFDAALSKQLNFIGSDKTAVDEYTAGHALGSREFVKNLKEIIDNAEQDGQLDGYNGKQRYSTKHIIKVKPLQGGIILAGTPPTLGTTQYGTEEEPFEVDYSELDLTPTYATDPTIAIKTGFSAPTSGGNTAYGAYIQMLYKAGYTRGLEDKMKLGKGRNKTYRKKRSTQNHTYKKKLPKK